MIALTFSKYQPERICLAGALVMKYIDHCILWCHAKAEDVGLVLA